MINNVKTNSAVRICKILFKLAKKNLTNEDLLNSLEEQGVYAVETLYKYISTINFSGFEVEKINNIYNLTKIPPIIELTDDELLGLSLFLKYEFPEEKTKENLQKFILSLEKHLTKEIKNSLKKIKYINAEKNVIQQKQELIKKLDAYAKELIVVKIKLKNCEIHTGFPKSMETNSNKIIFKIYESNKFFDIDINDICNVEQLSQRNNNFNQLSSICFILKDNLAKSYKLKAGESVIEKKTDGSLVVKSTQEAENTLLKRLMRYGSHCEVKTPIDTRLKMIKLLEETYALYKSNEDI